MVQQRAFRPAQRGAPSPRPLVVHQFGDRFGDHSKFTPKKATNSKVIGGGSERILLADRLRYARLEFGAPPMRRGRCRSSPPREGIKGIDVAADIAASDAKASSGKFASGRTAELVDSDVLFRAFSTCDDSEGLRYAEYYVVPRKRGGFAVFAGGSKGGNVGTSGTVETKRTIFQKAAIQATE